MTQPLFLRTEPDPSHYINHQDKLAATTRLPPDPQMWTTAIYQLALEKLPELSEFLLNIEMDHQDLPSATALGHITVERKPSTSLDATSQLRPAVPGKKALIPVLVSGGELMPLDLLVFSTESAKVTYPLNSRRLRQAMFRPDVFDVTSFGPGNQSIAEAIYPSTRESVRGVMGGGMGGGLGGFMGKSASLLESVLATVGDEGRKQLLHKVASEPLFGDNEAARNVFALLLRPAEKRATDLTAKEAAAHAPPTVLQITDQGDGTYLYKRASSEAWLPSTMLLNRQQLLKVAADPEMLEAIDTEQGVTMGVSEDEEEPPGEMPGVLNTPGIARVTHKGAELLGMVFPSLIDPTGMELPIALFTNGSVYAMAPEVRGVALTGTPPSLPTGLVSGYGLFISTSISGKLQATVPYKILGAEGEGCWHFTTDDGSQGQLKVQGGLRKIVEIEGVTLIPDSFHWMPLDKSQRIELQQDETPVQIKAANERTVQVLSTGYHYELRGAPFHKLGQLHTLDQDEALFHLVGAGATPRQALTKLAEARMKSASFLQVPFVLTPAEHLAHEVNHKMASMMPRTNLQPANLVKEAAVLPDGQTIDTVLGLGMLTPENVAVFTAFIPELERTQRQLCEMLLASRLGLKALPEVALERAIAHIEPIIEGCFQLRFAEADQDLRMILDSPCRRYLLALLLSGWNVQDLEEHCLEHRLDYVSIQFLVYLAEKHRPPEVFRPKDLQHTESQTFLRELGLQGAIPRLGGDNLAAFRLMTQPAARQALETLGIAKIPPGEVLRTLRELRIKTSEQVVAAYYSLFWSVDEMDLTTLRAILHLRTPSTDQLSAQAKLEDAVAAAAGADAVPLTAALPEPHNSQTPTATDKLRARDRREKNQRTLIRRLHESTPTAQKLREATALKYAGYRDPLLPLTGLPPTPLSAALSRAQLGLPLSRMDMKKANEVAMTLLLAKLVEHLRSDHPEASRKVADYANSMRILQQVTREFGASDSSLRSQLAAIQLMSRAPGQFGPPPENTQDTYITSPYLSTDQETAKEMVKNAKAAAAHEAAQAQMTRIAPEEV